jgi:ParB family transcriptional regulator, chromosome partitioning protein
MAQQKRGLGKGLGALIPTAPIDLADGRAGGSTLGRSAMSSPSDLGAIPGAYFDEIPVDWISPNPRQPRQVFDEESLAELADSIMVVGLLQPIVVRKTGSGRYQIVMGERRWRACQLADLDVVPAIVKETSDSDLLRDALIENLHRQQLNALEEAAAYQQLLDDFEATHEELARRIGRSRPHITNTIRLLNLPPSVQRRVAAGVLSAGHARALLAIADSAIQEQLAHRIVAEGLSVRAVEEIVALGVDVAKPQRQQARKQPVAPRLADLANRLSDELETRVKVELGQRKGKIVVEFASLDDLDRIVRAISPSHAASLSDSAPLRHAASLSDSAPVGHAALLGDAAEQATPQLSDLSFT